MGLFGLRTKPRTLAIASLADRRLKAAAELIDERLRDKFDDQVSEKNLKTALEQLNRSDHGVFRDLSPYEIQLLRDALIPSGDAARPTLADFLRDDAPPKARGPFATALETRAILDPEVRSCAEVVARNFGEGETQVNLSELRMAQEALARGELPPGAQGVAALNADNLAQIELFLMTGKGGLVTHEGVSIAGHHFKEAFPLPGNPGDADVLASYDRFFESSGYDLIFIQGPPKADAEHPQLYVVLHESGDLPVRVGMPVQLGAEGRYQDLGQVVAVHDVANSVQEATWGFWSDVALGLVKNIRGRLGTDLDTRLESAAARAASGLGGNDVDKKGTLNMTGMLAAGALGAGLGAAVSTVAFPLTTAVGASVTGFNLLDAHKNRYGRDKSAIFHAMGVGVNLDQPIR